MQGKSELVMNKAQPIAGAADANGPVVRALKRRILIAEDSAISRKQMQQLLEGSLNVVVDTVADGSQALSALSSSPIASWSPT